MGTGYWISRKDEIQIRTETVEVESRERAGPRVCGSALSIETGLGAAAPSGWEREGPSCQAVVCVYMCECE